jgi:hypothetical protein
MIAVCAFETSTRYHESVESECGAAAVGRAYRFAAPFVWRCLVARPWLRFHTPLIEPDVRIARIRLSDKTSRLRPRHVVLKPAQTYEPEVPVEVRERIASADNYSARLQPRVRTPTSVRFTPPEYVCERSQPLFLKERSQKQCGITALSE